MKSPYLEVESGVPIGFSYIVKYIPPQVFESLIFDLEANFFPLGYHPFLIVFDFLL